VAAVARVGLDGKRAVVAGRAHADDLGLHDLVEPGACLRGLAEKGQGSGQGGGSHGKRFLGDHVGSAPEDKKDETSRQGNAARTTLAKPQKGYANHKHATCHARPVVVPVVVPCGHCRRAGLPSGA